VSDGSVTTLESRSEESNGSVMLERKEQWATIVLQR